MTDSPFAAMQTLTVYEPPQQKAEPQSFQQWLETGKPRSRFVYCTRHCLDIRTPPETLEVALQAREAYARGEVQLVQKRVEKDGPSEYTAVMNRDRCIPKVGWAKPGSDLSDNTYTGKGGSKRD